MTKSIVSALICLTLSACGGPQLLKGGAETDAPGGYVKLCKEHPETAACQVK